MCPPSDLAIAGAGNPEDGTYSHLLDPDTDISKAAYAHAAGLLHPAILDHSIRVYLYANALAKHTLSKYFTNAHCRDLLLTACLFHDIGTTQKYDGSQRFEVEGADLAAEVLRAHGVPEADIDRVWEAIALHASHGLAERRGLLTYLTHRGVFIDAGRITDVVADELRAEVLNAYPKPTDGPYLADAIIAHGRRSLAAAPPGSLAAHLILQQGQLQHRHR